MLVIPAIEIQHNRCLRNIRGSGGGVDEVYAIDPAKMALLWRKENARTIHMTDYDGLYTGQLENVDNVVRVAKAVEIPVQLMSRFADVEECRMWLDTGIYRIIVHDLVQRDPEGLQDLVQQFGPSRITAGVMTRNGSVCATWRDVVPVDSLDFADMAMQCGIKRLFFTDRDYEGVLHGPNYDQLQRLATNTNIPITAAGGVATVEHLWMLQDMEQYGVDSVVIGRAFYENRFPCQQLWRDVEMEQKRINNPEFDKISTSSLIDHRTGNGS